MCSCQPVLRYKFGDMGTISALVVLSGGIDQSQVDSPLKGPVMRSFDVLYVVSLDKLIYIYTYIYIYMILVFQIKYYKYFYHS